MVDGVGLEPTNPEGNRFTVCLRYQFAYPSILPTPYDVGVECFCFRMLT